MKKIIIGGIFIVLGLYGLSAFSSALFMILAGTVPVMLIVGGAITVFLNLDKAALRQAQDTEFSPSGGEDIFPTPSVFSPEAEPQAPREANETSAAKDMPPSVETAATEDSTISESTRASENPAAETDDGKPLVGNTGTQVFHQESCKYAANKKCTAFFATKDEALEAGYKPCKVCCRD